MLRPKSETCLQKSAVAAGLCFFLLTSTVFAQGQGQGQSGAPGQNKGKPSIEKRVVIVPSDSADKDTKKPEKPSRPNTPPPSSEVQNLVKEFNQARETYLEQRKELARQMKNDSKETREEIRNQSKELLDQLKEQQKALRQEARDRAKELKRELHPDLDRVIDSGIGEGRGR